jgi:hypothetical protein
VYALIFVACAAPLLDGERVLGVDVPAEFIFGAPGDRLGSAVAGRGDRWIATAPGASRTWRDGEPGDVASAWVGFWGESEVLVTSDGTLTVNGELSAEIPDATAWAFGENGIAFATVDGLRVLDPPLAVAVRGVEALAWGERRLLARVCDPACVGMAWALDGEALGAYAPAGAGGAVGEWDGVAWAGAPAWDEPEAPGRVCSEAGVCVDGLPGDHLGATLGGGFTAGTFNKWVVPARARLVPLDGGDVLALETGAEAQPLHLAGDTRLVVGAPYAASEGLPAGAVVTVAP